MPDSQDEDSATARPPARFGQELRERFRDVLGDDLEQPRNQTPGEAADFSPLSAKKRSRR